MTQAKANTLTLLDGGLGQEIYHRSSQPAHPLWSVKVMREQPEIVVGVHVDFITAGARVIEVNSYTTTPSRLARDGQPEWFEPLQRQALDLAQQARRQADVAHPVQIAGCLPPLKGSYSPESAPFYQDSLAEYRQIAALQAEGVDLFICETLPTITESRAAAVAALETGKPTLLSFTVRDDDSACLRSGETVAEAVAACQDLPLAGLLLNCSIPEAISAALPDLARSHVPYGAYANGFTSVEGLKPGGTVDALSTRQDLDGPHYAEFVLGWIEQGATLVGGCCEVSPAHLDHLSQVLEAQGYQLGGIPLRGVQH